MLMNLSAMKLQRGKKEKISLSVNVCRCSQQEADAFLKGEKNLMVSRMNQG
jgi:hypothetical protein